MPTDIKLPELGENIEGGDVLRVMVKPGDLIKKDQAVLELETDKATIEVPSSGDGVVKDIKVKQGEKVKVGQTILVIEEGQSAEGVGQQEEGKGQRAEGKESAPEPSKAEPAKAVQPAQPAAEPKRKAEVV